MTVEVDSYLGSVLGADLGQGLILRDEYLQLLDYILICLFVFSDRVSSTAQPGLELFIKLRLTLNFLSSGFQLLSCGGGGEGGGLPPLNQ